MAEVLAIDDDAHWLRYYEECLPEHGHTVHTVVNGREALVVLAQTPADAVILDIRMAPSGREVLGWIKDRWPSIPVIVSSAYAGYRSDPDFERADAFVVKSGDVTALVEALSRVTENGVGT